VYTEFYIWRVDGSRRKKVNEFLLVIYRGQEVVTGRIKRNTATILVHSSIGKKWKCYNGIAIVEMAFKN